MKYVFHAMCVIMVWGCVFMASPEVFADTEVSGVITKNTDWTSAKSPYIVTGNIRVSENVKLTIGKNVKVQFRKSPLSTIGYYLQVDGTLVAQGEMNSPILFTSEDKSSYWGSIAFTDTSADWNSSTSKGSVIKYAIIEYAGNSQGNANRYGGAAINCFYARPLISDNIIRYSAGNGISVSADTNSTNGSSGIQKIYNNWIYNTSTAIYLTVDGCRIENNYFLSNIRAISFGMNLNKIEIVSNTLIDTLANATGSLINGSFYFLVDNNDQTLDTADPPTSVSIRKNVLKNGVEEPDDESGQVLMAFTEYAFTSANQDSSYVLTLTENTVENGENATWVYLYNWRHLGVQPLNMTSNYWGTTVKSDIEKGLYDNKNDFYLPVIDYDPYQNAEVSESGSSLLYPPVANAGRDQKVPGGVTVTLDGSGSYDPDERMRYQWAQTGENGVTLNKADTISATFDSPYSYTDSPLVFSLTVTDEATGLYDTDEVTVVVTESIANAGPDQIVQGNTKVTLDASKTHGLESIKTFQWKQLSGPDVELTGVDQQSASFMAPYVDKENELVFQLTVTDANGFSGTDEITITINENIANAGLDREIEPDETVVLDGSNTYDPDRIMDYKWEKIGGPSVELTFYDDNMKAKFIVPYIDEENSLLTFKLTVSNANDFISTDEVTLTIKEPETIVREKGDCFIGCLYGSASHMDLRYREGIIPLWLIFSLLLSIGMLGKGTMAAVRKYGKPCYCFPLILMLIVFITPDFGHAGYFSVGNGGGGEAEKYNISIETGAIRLGGETPAYLLGGGVFGMFHGYDDFPANTRDYPCPHSEFVNIDKIIEGIESGLFGKAGIGLSDTDIYVSALAGISMVTEVQLVQSNQTKLYYEQSSEQKFFGIYGGGIGYFPDRFRWEFCVQLDYDNRRGVVGSIGFHW